MVDTMAYPSRAPYDKINLHHSLRRLVHQADANTPAFVFFNKYAGHKDPATGPVAFCALRDGLDASNFKRFPAAEFGRPPDNKKSMERHVKIAKAYVSYGARMDDVEKATGGGMLIHRRA